MELILEPQRGSLTCSNQHPGDEISRQVVYIDNSPLRVTTNLSTALRYLRSENAPITLWIDAICIYQDDVDERNQQVSIMPETYASAEGVLVWLGESTPGIDVALTFYADGANDPGVSGYSGPHEALRSLFERPWWTRVWVVPEVFLAKLEPLVGCGHTWVPLEPIITSFRPLRMLDQYDDNGNPPTRSPEVVTVDNQLRLLALSSRRRTERQSPEMALAELLLGTWRRESKDPRDRVYALLGMADQDTRRGLTIDYRESISTVYQRAMSLALADSPKGFDLLPFAAGPKTMSLPSWCVDFSKIGWDGFDVSEKWPGSLVPTQGNSSRLFKRIVPARKPELDLDRGVLSLQGLSLGVMTSCTRIRLDVEEDTLRAIHEFQSLTFVKQWRMEFIHKMLEFKKAAQQTLNVRPEELDQGPERLAKGLLWETLNAGADNCKGSLQLNDPNGEFRHGAALLEPCASNAVPQWPTEPAEKEHHLDIPEAWREHALSIVEYQAFSVPNCTLFCTDAEYIGRAVDSISEGDNVGLLHGSPLPAVLRPRGEDTLELLTFAWVPDLLEAQTGEFDRGSKFLRERIAADTQRLDLV